MKRKEEEKRVEPWEKRTLVCRVLCATLKTGRNRRAEITLGVRNGEGYTLFLEPGDSLDLIYDAWARGVEVVLVARVATIVRSYTALILDVEKIALAGLPKGAVAY